MLSSISTFQTLELSKNLLAAVKGYSHPTEIQKQAIPVLRAGHNILAQAQTGTGKTAAFCLPMLDAINLNNNNPQVLILAPTRELAIQITATIQNYGRFLKSLRVINLYGGQPYYPQIKKLKKGPHIIVGTPGRIIDHLKKKNININEIRHFILDEADEMLKMGFLEDVEWVLQQLKGEIQQGWFSATMSSAVVKLANKHMRKYVTIQLEASNKAAKTVKQFYALMDKRNKIYSLLKYLENEKIDSAIIFTNTKKLTTQLSEQLQSSGYLASAVNGDLRQHQRERIINSFKKKRLNIIVATDVAARGLDIKQVSHVINFDIPHPTSYIHRIGRTGRAGGEGKALLMVTYTERAKLKNLERAIGLRLINANDNKRAST